MVFPHDHPNTSLAGQPKGIRTILEERGLWSIYEKKVNGKTLFKCSSCKRSGTAQDAKSRADRLMKEAEAHGFFVNNPLIEASNQEATNIMCCASKILSLQTGFLNKKPLLQMVIEDAGHICLFLPKFCCELNPIKLFWGYIKDGVFSLLPFINNKPVHCFVYN